MSSMIHVPNGLDTNQKLDSAQQFKKDIEYGLSKPNKEIHSKYFYDAKGCDLFNRITRHPDYYLTNSEIEILNIYKKELSSLIKSSAFNLIELGPGEGVKTKILMQQFLNDGLEFSYLPIDISQEYLIYLDQQFCQAMPNLVMTPVHADYFSGLHWLRNHSDRRNIVLFLGSSIGNFNAKETKRFLDHLWETLNDGDCVLFGFDLRKDVSLLMNAYDDSDGLTREFNLNLLRRMNNELGANFNVEKFQHYATYNVYTGAMESYLISLESQFVSFDALQRNIFFEAIEPIHVEYSHKYLLRQITEMAKSSNFEIIQNYFDKQHFFVDSLWCVNK